MILVVKVPFSERIPDFGAAMAETFGGLFERFNRGDMDRVPPPGTAWNILDVRGNVVGKIEVSE